MAYIDARAEMRDADKNLYYVNAVQPEKGREDSSKDPLKTVYAMADMAGADKYNAGELAGFKAVYQEGESVIRLQLQRPSYGWNQEFVLPVQM
jgi:outer membrane scaffolding protein for murein synthesis (MipA/OmpV family)